jgi:uncharacterized membrane protein
VTLVPALALAAALLSAAATIFIRQGLRGSDPYTGFWISLIVGTLSVWIAVLVTGVGVPLTTKSLLLFALAGLIGTVGGRLLRFISIEKMGASVSSAVLNLQPLIATVLAILVLGEQVTVPILAGTIVIVVGTVILSSSGGRLGFQPWQIALPLASATCFGIVAILRKVGLSQMGPIPGTAVNLTTALLAYSALMLAAGHRGILACRGRTLGYFVAAGLTENVGVFLTIVGLSLGAVSVVTPLTASAPLFVLLLAPFFLRGVEVFSGRVVVGTLLIVFGVYLITAL